MPEPKEIVIQPQTDREHLSSFVKTVTKTGVKLFICSPSEVSTVKTAGSVAAAPSEKADIFLASNLKDAEAKRKEGRRFALKIKVNGNEDVDEAISAAKLGAEAVVVETGDWKIIPLENLIAGIRRHTNTRIYAKVDSVEEIPTMFAVLEMGVDGVVLSTGNQSDVERASKHLSSLGRVGLIPAKVTEVKNVGVGDRACIDTASMLNLGEGILVGSQAKVLFLVHNESSGSKFTSPRPFRVNAGSIHSYTLTPNGKTRYLSELESGDEVLAVDKDGKTRTVVVGRVKIERRPLTLIKASYQGGSGSVLLQNAETIPLVGKEGQRIPVTSLKIGDEILVRLGEVSGRHFGTAVDEFVLEK
ncbi:MAG: 3-dehydroquinate synthase II [Thaumarchaeota archaeon]|nr:3-dehydroquinate synthase II [Nitrososphaerota archaeon]MCL5318730.1 3-dehydroquinate synthase II [Nitrososphaerota archaeon]